MRAGSNQLEILVFRPQFADGLHEYVTTPIKRILRLAGEEVYYLQTANSRYRMEVQAEQEALLEAPAVK